MLNCVICRASVPTEAPDVMSVLLRFDPVGRQVVQFAHEMCAVARGPHRRGRRTGRGARDLHASAACKTACRAALVWEPRRPVFDLSRSEAVAVMVYRELGFAASDAGVSAIYGPTPPGLVLEGDGAQLLLRSRREPLQWFDDVAAIAPPGWLEAARSERRCLLGRR